MLTQNFSSQWYAKRLFVKLALKQSTVSLWTSPSDIPIWAQSFWHFPDTLAFLLDVQYTV